MIVCQNTFDTYNSLFLSPFIFLPDGMGCLSSVKRRFYISLVMNDFFDEMRRKIKPST